MKKFKHLLFLLPVITLYLLSTAFKSNDANLGSAMTNVVSTLVDEDDGDFSAGNNSLREAIANAAAGSTITFDPALSGDTIILNGTQLTIDKDLTITGNVPINISGNEQSRVFDLTNNAIVTIEGLTIQDGNSGNGNGGGILVNSDVTLTLRNSTIRNSSGRSSGAIDNVGTLTVEKCTFWGNRSTNFSGGAMVNRGVATIESSTISGNTSNTEGGALFNSAGATLMISHSTITDNQAVNGAGGITSHRFNSTETRLYGTIVAGNNGSGGDLELNGTNNTFVSDGYNLIGTLGDNVVMGGTGDQVNVAEPKIGALADNGGPTLTHILLTGSPAIDAADNGNCPTTDQRGEARPIGGTCDIGALEAFVSTVADLTITDATVNEDVGTVTLIITSSATTNQDITVEYTTTDGTATADSDFTTTNGTATIPAGATQTTISVPIIDNVTFEPDAETFSVVLFKPTVASFADNSATITINDNDLGPSLIVTSLSDGQDGNFNFGENTLREAFALATDGDIITFDPALSGDTITLNGNQFGISKEVSIVSTIPITISADSLNRIFSVNGNGDLTLDGLTIRDGVRGSTTVGGVIQVNSGGRLTVRNCTVSNSTAGFSAIGIWAGGTAIFENSLITENSGRQGGAFWVRGNLTMTNCTISNNTAGGGAAIYTGIQNPVITLTHCSLIGNFATGAGSGIRWGNGATITIGSTIIANDISERSNCSNSSFISLGNNIISDGTCFDGSVASDQFNTDPMVAPLADNGGPTLTHALLCGSPAIDAGGTTNCTATDQRGVMRPIDGNGDATATCDVGAFESPSKVIPTITFTSSDADNAICPSEEVTFTASGGDNYEFFVNTSSVQEGTDATYKTSTLTDGAEVYVIVTNSDECDKTSSTITVTVSDTENPVPHVTNLPDIMAQCSVKVVEPTATDNCAGEITATTTDPLTYQQQGTYTINWKYDDNNGNVQMQSQKVIISDIQKPVPIITNLPDVIEQCETTVSAPKANDNCAGEIIATTTDPVAYAENGTYHINWTYDDGNGNIEMQTQTVIIEDCNTALHFDGQNDNVMVQGFIMPRSFTIEAMVNYTGSQNPTEAILAYNGNALFFGFDEGYLRLFGTDVQHLELFPTNVWKHVAVSFDDNSKYITLYVDGVQVRRRRKGNFNPFPDPNASNQLGLGAGLPGINGQLDEVRIWNMAIAPDDMMERSSCQLGGNENGLELYFDFEEGMPTQDNRNTTTLYDKSPNQYIGTLEHFNLVGTNSNFVSGSPMISELCAGSLAVEWLDFNAQNIDNQHIALNWQVANEVATTHYEVERSADGKTFSTIGKVNTNGDLNYQFLDKNPLRGDNYYRIREVENSGRFSWSETKLVQLKSTASTLLVYPNPTTDVVHLQLPLTKMDNAVLTLIDVHGKTILQQKWSSQLDVHLLSNGIYFLRVQTKNGSYEQRIIKQ